MIAVWVGLAHAVSVGEVVNPRSSGGWVSDGAAILTPEQTQRLERRLAELHADLDVEVLVVTVREVDLPTPKDFATALFDDWRIGDREANNGLLVLVVTGERRMEMETGYGLEGVLPDGWLGTMQSEQMVPAFRTGDYGVGLEAGLGAIDARLRQFPDDARLGSAGPIAERRSQVTAQVAAVGAIGGVGTLGGLGLGGVLIARRRRRERTCDACQVYMPQLDDDDDDRHLSTGQRTEENVGSIDWIVHQCPTCQATRTFERRAWFSGYRRCERCHNRTRSSSSVTVRHATQVSTGRVRVTERCAHCQWQTSYERTTARLPSPSSSGGSFGSGRSSGGRSSGGGRSGGGRSGGGRSGGGGAGSSW